ncbi:TetR/AcrR family transcriptional regulator [Actinopolymorpha alba]|uniref:TetR/AcrR family transcriptional regulator n=1 Tax=Actinopolymorpha alba TaxID=533267 RepID=UPI001ED99126|nr:TetR family transcriptional regulator [Actinopolymorpha alba]
MRAERSGATRDLILTAAERLFAEHGVFAVSNRQVSEAAGQGNNFAVGYHFGTKADLVRAIVRKHDERIERLRLRMLAKLGDSAEVRDWVACLVRPVTEHLATLGSPTWYARFGAQVMTDPALRAIMIDEALSAPPLQELLDGLNHSLPALPFQVRLQRGEMARHLIVHMCADHERALADGTPPASTTWQELATGLIDAIVGLLLAPVTSADPGTSSRE